MRDDYERNVYIGPAEAIPLCAQSRTVEVLSEPTGSGPSLVLTNRQHC